MDWGNWFVISRVRYIEVLFHTFYNLVPRRGTGNEAAFGLCVLIGHFHYDVI